MKFRTRLRVTFITLIVLPLFLMIFAFLTIGLALMSARTGGRIVSFDNMTDNFQEIVAETDRVFDMICEHIDENDGKIEDIEFLEELNRKYTRKSTNLIVRKGEALFYAGNEKDAGLIFSLLPEYSDHSKEEQLNFYLDKYGKYIKQKDFLFSDGAHGSIFIVTTATNLISKRFLMDMLIAIGGILILTSLILCKFIEKTLIKPVSELNTAMQQIKDGNLEYSLETTGLKGEVGDLYSNYEDMRLRLKESTEASKQAEEKNRELISNISHDLKTPITSVKGYVEGIMDGVADTPEKMDKYIKTIYNKANDMEKLINELTYYSKIDNNRIPYDFHRINVADYFGDCVEEVGIDLEQRNITLNFLNLTPADTVVIADPEQMKKVINNIISNSVKYMDKPKGNIEIRILDQADSIQIEIEDNGKGIAQKDLGMIFERFYRTDASRNSAQGGSGIGLSIVKKIVEDHGGYIWATGKEGEGICIHFVLRKYIELQPAD